MKKILLAILLLCGIAHADTYPLANYTVSLDLDSSQYAMLPFDLQVNDDGALAQTVISKDVNYNFGMLGLAIYFEPTPISTLKPITVSTLETICARVTSTEENGSVIATGLAKQGGRRCWYKSIALDTTDGKYTKAVSFVAAFDDAALNEKLVKEFDAKDVSYA